MFIFVERADYYIIFHLKKKKNPAEILEKIIVAREERTGKRTREKIIRLQYGNINTTKLPLIRRETLSSTQCEIIIIILDKSKKGK